MSETHQPCRSCKSHPKDTSETRLLYRARALKERSRSTHRAFFPKQAAPSPHRSAADYLNSRPTVSSSRRPRFVQLKGELAKSTPVCFYPNNARWNYTTPPNLANTITVCFLSLSAPLSLPHSDVCCLS